jgi:hypothetical protein
VRREIFKAGLHRDLVTNITYTSENNEDLQRCSFVVRENITKDHYIYYEEVTRDLPGLESWPHHKVMNIEAPTSNSVDEEWIWRLPLSERQQNSYIINFESKGDDETQMNKVSILYRFHYRY